MLRTSLKQFRLNKVFVNTSRKQSTASGGGSTSKLILGLIGVGSIGTAGTIAYAGYSDDARKSIEQTIPGATYVLDSVLGPNIKPEKPQKSLSYPGSALEKTYGDKLSKESNLKVKDPGQVPSPTPSIPSLPKHKDEPQTSSPLPEPPKTETIQPEKPSFTKIIEELKLENEATLHAISEAKGAIDSYLDKIRMAIDKSGNLEEFSAAADEITNTKDNLIEKARKSMETAKEQFSNLTSKIEDVKKVTPEDSDLLNAEILADELKQKMKNLSSEISSLVKDNSFVALNFKTDDSKKSFEELYNRLSTSEKNLGPILDALQRKKMDKEVHPAEYDSKVLRAELDRQRSQLFNEYRYRLDQKREEMEDELRTQLKRQAAAHSEHLNEALHLQESDLKRKFENKLQDEIQKVQDEYYRALSVITGDLEGLQNGLISRAETDKEAFDAQKIWSACEALNESVKVGKRGSTNWEDKVQPLKENIEAIKNANESKSEYVEAVLESFTEKSLNRGVLTDEALKERFVKVEKICNRVALIDDKHGSLIRYLLSYVQSFLILDEYEDSSHIFDKEIDTNKISTQEILARSRYCLQKDDLVQAVKYMNLLHGAPRNVASDWIKEAVLTVETKQAVNALIAYAADSALKAL